MDHLSIVSILHGFAYLLKQFQTIAECKAKIVTPGVDTHPIDVLHHEIGIALVSSARIKQASDIGMVL